ncbi:MAG: O-antigen ligase family protein [Flavobacteriales bacterium]|nr:O-antigen ligase family protein [Flavobacteriales bacterium]MBK7753198.1 O-antigen ligase family protein [Flavobacteriales bacterium]MBK9074946.1 O-antigen ligase family protein [Flavobacteriales bacterium]MBK9540195.1 O-antigen ligase family protein [Flavobacteriales bacterium]MBP6390583.1 O-antigen ligase family protein [Flavobacteriales bacterium]
MLDFLRDRIQLFVLILAWVFATVFAGPLIYVLLPITVFLFYRRESFPDMLFGFIFILVLSDMTPEIFQMRKIKTAKYAYIIALSVILLADQWRFQPMAAVFKLFLPFFVYSFFPLIFSNDPITGVQKTISYALLYLVVPNYVLLNFRRHGWDFFKNLMYFLVALLLASQLMRLGPNWWAFAGGRFRGFFGNPNGLGIFTFLVFMLFVIINSLKRDLLPFRTKMIFYAIVGGFLIACGSRTSLTATLMFLLFSRFFSLSPFIGVIMFIVFLGVVEAVSSNLTAIVFALGLQHYMRVETLEDGSGRYIAWAFAWGKIQDYFMFGGGFGNDEFIMRKNYAYLRTLGHHGGVHNSYLTMWFNVGIIGLLIFFRSFFLIFIKASKRVPMALATMFAVMFSVLYESWLSGSLNPFTIMLVIILTLVTEPEIVEWEERQQQAAEEEPGAVAEPQWQPLPPGH